MARWLEGWMSKEKIGTSPPDKSRTNSESQRIFYQFFMFNSSHVIQSRESMAWLGFGLNSQMVKMSPGPSVNRQNSPSSSLSSLTIIVWFFKLFVFPSSPSCIKTLWKEEGKVRGTSDWLPLSLWKGQAGKNSSCPFLEEFMTRSLPWGISCET